MPCGQVEGGGHAKGDPQRRAVSAAAAWVPGVALRWVSVVARLYGRVPPELPRHRKDGDAQANLGHSE